MSHYCRICGCHRPNEKFSGHGHKTHVCKKCASLPKEEFDAIELEAEIFGYMSQSHISEKNVKRLKNIAQSANPRISNLAAVALEVAAVKPHKNRRLKFLAKNHRELLNLLKETGLIDAHLIN